MFNDFNCTYCDKFMCKRQDCIRHPINTPSDMFNIYIADFCPNGLYEECPHYRSKNAENR